MRRYGFFICALFTGMALILSLAVTPAYTQDSVPTAAPGALIGGSDRYIRSDRLGITFISSLDNHNSDERYRNALLLGAGWNRWPLYWDRVESSAGQFDWTGYDQLVIDDMRQQLQVNAILLGNPSFHRDGNRPAGIYEPIFNDGSDVPAAGKGLNPANPWVNFVYRAVQRYKPGGELARQQGWRGNQGIRVWEIWNEPDHPMFWQGTYQDYARLLKISYLVIKWIDPQATVLFGGLLFGTDNNWLALVLDDYLKNDAFREQNNWYFDAVAIHSYNSPWRSGWLTLWTNQTLIAYDLKKPIWLNESGVAVWNDYPGPVWASPVDGRIGRATANQQAWYFIQSTAYAWSEGADVVFFHQLYDDCGDQPAGTDFPPHNGELCVGDALCSGDAFGIFRNQTTSICYSQHPFPGTPRPIASAYRLMADIFGTEPFIPVDSEIIDQTATVILFERPASGETVVVMWNETLAEYTLNLNALSNSAQLYTLDDSYTLTPNAENQYSLRLPPAVPDYYPNLEPGQVSAIGGAPLILIESGTGGPSILPTSSGVDVVPASGTAVPTLAPTSGPLPDPVQPTIVPSNDTQPPTTSMDSLPNVSPTTFTVNWDGQDNSGIDKFLVWVRVDGGNWHPWLETSSTRSDYTGEPGHRYEFAVWAVDLAGNWSLNTQLVPQASTRID